MEISDYGDILRGQKLENRKQIIDAIYDRYDIGSEDISEASNAAGVSYPDSPIEYFFLARCINSARDLKREKDEGYVDDIYDSITEFADSAVPYQTYVVWMLWVEFGYETDAYEDFGLEPSLDNLVNVAQVQLMQYAQGIISSIVTE